MKIGDEESETIIAEAWAKGEMSETPSADPQYASGWVDAYEIAKAKGDPLAASLGCLQRPR